MFTSSVLAPGVTQFAARKPILIASTLKMRCGGTPMAARCCLLRWLLMTTYNVRAGSSRVRASARITLRVSSLSEGDVSMNAACISVLFAPARRRSSFDVTVPFSTVTLLPK